MPFLQAEQLHIVSLMLDIQHIGRNGAIRPVHFLPVQPHLMSHQIEFLFPGLKQQSSGRLFLQAHGNAVDPGEILSMPAVHGHPARIFRRCSGITDPAEPLSEFQPECILSHILHQRKDLSACHTIFQQRLCLSQHGKRMHDSFRALFQLPVFIQAAFRSEYMVSDRTVVSHRFKHHGRIHICQS